MYPLPSLKGLIYVNGLSLDAEEGGFTIHFDAPWLLTTTLGMHVLSFFVSWLVMTIAGSLSAMPLYYVCRAFDETPAQKPVQGIEQ